MFEIHNSNGVRVAVFAASYAKDVTEAAEKYFRGNYRANYCRINGQDFYRYDPLNARTDSCIRGEWQNDRLAARKINGEC